MAGWGEEPECDGRRDLNLGLLGSKGQPLFSWCSAQAQIQPRQLSRQAQSPFTFAVSAPQHQTLLPPNMNPTAVFKVTVMGQLPHGPGSELLAFILLSPLRGTVRAVALGSAGLPDWPSVFTHLDVSPGNVASP